VGEIRFISIVRRRPRDQHDDEIAVLWLAEKAVGVLDGINVTCRWHS